MSTNRYDELLLLLLEKGDGGVMYIEDIKNGLNIKGDDLFERLEKIIKHDRNLLSYDIKSSRIGIPKGYMYHVKYFFESGGFTEINNIKSLEIKIKKKGLELTETQLKNIKLTRRLAIIGCVTGIVSLIWKIVELLINK